MKIHVCDICKRTLPNTKIKYKYRAKQEYGILRGENYWKKIEICLFCLDKIVQADKAENEGK